MLFVSSSIYFKGVDIWKGFLTHLPMDKIGRHYTDNIFNCIFMNEKFCILIWISQEYVPKTQLKIN